MFRGPCQGVRGVPTWGCAVSTPCVGHPGVFFPDPSDLEAVADAKAICATCPHAGPCLEDALARRERFGVWGGVLLDRPHHHGRVMLTSVAMPTTPAPPAGTERLRCELCRTRFVVRGEADRRLPVACDEECRTQLLAARRRKAARERRRQTGEVAEAS